MTKTNIKKLEHFLNLAIIVLSIVFVTLMSGSVNNYIARQRLIDQSPQLSAQTYSEKVAYTKLLAEAEKDQKSAEAYVYLPPPSIISIKSGSAVFVNGSGALPIFAPSEVMEVQGQAAPDSNVKLFFEPGGFSVASASDKEGLFTVKIAADSLPAGNYQVFVEGTANEVSTGRVRRLDILMKEPVDPNLVLFYGSIGMLLLVIIVVKMYVGNSVKLQTT